MLPLAYKFVICHHNELLYYCTTITELETNFDESAVTGYIQAISTASGDSDEKSNWWHSSFNDVNPDINHHDFCQVKPQVF